jgi:hypothetical protein
LAQYAETTAGVTLLTAKACSPRGLRYRFPPSTPLSASFRDYQPRWIPANLIVRPVEETRRQIEQAMNRVAEEEEAAWRASFKPHAIIRTERNRPEPIFGAAMMDVERLLRVDFDSEGDRQS